MLYSSNDACTAFHRYLAASLKLVYAGYTMFQGMRCHQGYLKAAKFVCAEIAQRFPDLFDSIRRGACSITIAGHSLGGAVAALLHLYLSMLAPPVLVLGSLGIGAAPCIAPASHQLAQAQMGSGHVMLWEKYDPVPCASPARLHQFVIRILQTRVEDLTDEQAELSRLISAAQGQAARDLWQKQYLLNKKLVRAQNDLADAQQRGRNAPEYVPVGQVVLTTKQRQMFLVDMTTPPRLVVRPDHLFVASSRPPHGIFSHPHSPKVYHDRLQNIRSQHIV